MAPAFQVIMGYAPTSKQTHRSTWQGKARSITRWVPTTKSHSDLLPKVKVKDQESVAHGDREHRYRVIEDKANKVTYPNKGAGESHCDAQLPGSCDKDLDTDNNGIRMPFKLAEGNPEMKVTA